MKIRGLIFLVAPLLGLVGCGSTVDVSMNQSRLESPEVNAKPLTFNISAGQNTRHQIEFDENNSDNDSVDLSLFLKGSVTAAEGLELYVKDSSRSVIHLGMKYQFWGDHRESSDKGNFSQAISIGYETKFSDGGSKEAVQSDFGDYSYWQSDTKIYDVAWILGYRFNKHVMVYGGPFYQQGKMELSSERQSDDIYDGSNGKQLGLSFATEFRFSFGLSITGELAYTDTEWANYSESAPSYSVKFDYQF